MSIDQANIRMLRALSSKIHESGMDSTISTATKEVLTALGVACDEAADDLQRRQDEGLALK
jgi:hypothetical protein